MNALSWLASEKVLKTEKGRWGTGKDGQFDFIPSGESEIEIRGHLTPEEKSLIESLSSPVCLDIVMLHVGRLALIKKINASESTMNSVLKDMAFELCEFSELAILISFREIKREPGPWMPDLGTIIKKCEANQKLVNGLFQKVSDQKLLTVEKQESPC